MMKSFRKNTYGFTTLELVLIIILVVVIVAAGWMVLKNNRKNSTSSSPNKDIFVTYNIDENNTCGWQDGKVFTSTKVASRYTSTRVQESKEAEFLIDSAAKHVCAYKDKYDY